MTRFVRRLGYASYEAARVDARQELATGSRLYAGAAEALNQARVRRINAEQAYRNAGVAFSAEQASGIAVMIQQRTDLKAQYATIRSEIEPVVKDVIESQYFIGGPKIAELEAATAKYCQAKHAIGCAR